MVKPDSIVWGSDAEPNIVRPSLGRRVLGWFVDQELPIDWLNWMHQSYYKWLEQWFGEFRRIPVFNFIDRDVGGGFSSHLFGCCEAGASLIACGATEEIQTSTDSVNWTSQTTPTSQTLNEVAYDGSSLACAVGNNGKIITSPGTAFSTWTTRTPAGGYSGTFRGLDHNQSGLWVAGGDYNSSINLMSSTNGTTWTDRTPGGMSTGFRMVRYRNSLWIAAGDSGKIYTSTNGTSWTARTAAGSYTDTFWMADYSSELSLWAMCGASGEIQTSPDGITWTQRTSGTSQSLRTMVWTGDFFFCAGGNGQLFYSPDGVTWTSVPSFVGDEVIESGVWSTKHECILLTTSNLNARDLQILTSLRI